MLETDPRFPYLKVMKTAQFAACIYITCLYPLTVTAAVPPAFFSCTDYHCDEGQTVSLNNRQWREIRALFSQTSTPAEERQQIRKAIALFETEVGLLTGTWRDRAKNAAGAGLPGQLDCISESKNTTTYLQMLSEGGLLRWHRVEKRQVRHPLIFNVHWAAVILDESTGTRYAVDSWFLDNGQPPYIQPLEAWLSGRSFDRGQEDLGHE